MEKPMITIIVPVYNVEKYLVDCLESIVNQSGSDFEVILVNDGSTDRSGEICDQYAEKYSFLRVIHQNNKGLSGARNSGYLVAQGEWISFVDSDDIISADYLISVRSLLQEDVDIIVVGYQKVKEEITFAECGSVSSREKAVTSPLILSKQEISACQLTLISKYYKCKIDDRIVYPAVAWGKFYKHSLIKENGLLFQEGLLVAEDTLYNVWAFEYAKKILVIEKKLYFYRQRSASLINQYRRNIFEQSTVFMDYLHVFVEQNYPASTLFKEALDYRIVITLLYSILRDFCHPQNNENYKVRKESFLQVRSLPAVDSALKNCGKKHAEFHIRKAEAIAIHFAQKKWFFLLNMLVKVRFFYQRKLK